VTEEQIMTLQAVTANRLRDGQVVYLTSDLFWSETLQAGRLVKAGTAAEALLQAAQESVEAQIIVEPYLIPVDRDAAGDQPPRAVGQRETIRAAGPSVRLDLGHQAAQE
jgi:Protein of unknown function (DUF2849)